MVENSKKQKPDFMRTKWKCLDCHVDTGKIGEHYMLKDEVWFLVNNSKSGMLCIGCLEDRLGRKLLTSDFKDCHINRPASGKYFSQRLTDRLQGL